MVQKVHSGERITASQYNDVVDALGGADIPSKGFVKTPEGVVQTYGSDLEAQANQRCAPFLQAAVGPALRKESTDISPFGGWDTYESLQETPPPEKHVYMHLGTPSFYNNFPYAPDKNPNLICNGLPSLFVAWSVGPYHHIVTDQDILTNNPDSDFDNFGTLKDNKVQCVYPGWVETPFQPTSGTSVYGCFYKLFDVTGKALAGSIFILTVSGQQNDPQEPGQSVLRLPYHSFTQPFTGPDGHRYVVGEQFSTPVLICEFQVETKVPGMPDNTKGMTSSKLVQCHTGPITHQEPQEAQLAWSVLGFVTGNDNGDPDETDITSFPEMKIGNDSTPNIGQQWGVMSVGNEKYLWARNLQVSGKQAIVKLDPSTPVIEGVLSLEQIEGMELPFVNVCKEPRGFSESALDIAKAAYLVLPKTFVDLPSICGATGLLAAPTVVNALPFWREDLLSWEIIFSEGYSGGVNNLLGSFMACEIRFDGTGSYTWHVPRSSVFQGSWANSLRDIAIPDMHYLREVQGEVVGNASIQYTGWLSATNSDGVHYNQPDETWNALSACHPKALQLFNFDRQDYLSSLTNALSSEGLSALDLVVRHRNKESGSTLEYYTLSSLLSGSALPCDTEATAGLQKKYKSLDTMLSGDGSPYYELHDFQKADEPGYGTRVKFEDSQHEEDFSIANGTQFVVRKPNGAGGYDIKYQHLSVIQEHERVDSSGAAIQTISRSLQYETYPGIGTNYDVMELYNFSSGCTTSLVSADISADSGNAVLVRTKNRDTYDLQYMDFKSIDNFTKKYVGDSQLDQQPLTPVDKSANVYWSNNDQKYAVELYNFKNGADTANVSIRTDGNTYWWPQNVKTTQQMNEWDYVLVKHLDSQGNQELQYKQLAVTMPDLSGLGDGLSAISAVVYEHSIEITTLSSEVVELSSKLSADYWESGGDHSTCYGSDIGNSNQTVVIDLDNYSLEGCLWTAPNFEATGIIQADGGFFAGCGAGYHFLDGCSYISNGSAFFDGGVQVGCQINIGSTYFNSSGSGYVAGCLGTGGSVAAGEGVYIPSNKTLTIGGTSLSETQLQQLLALL